MLSTIHTFLVNLLTPSKRWLSGLKKGDHAAIGRLQETELKNDANFIALFQDQDTHRYWVRHYKTQGMGDWFEYQPISDEEAEALKNGSKTFRDFVLRDWVDS